jgi:lysophospholipase L1-like esterase
MRGEGLLLENWVQVLRINTALGNGSGGYNPLYSNDGVVPNAAGYAVMTTMIQAAVKAVE